MREGKTETGTKRDRKRERKSLVDITNSTSVLRPSTVAEIWSKVRYTSNQHPYTSQKQDMEKSKAGKYEYIYPIIQAEVLFNLVNLSRTTTSR